MIHLPPSTLLSKHLTKTTLFAKRDMKAGARERFDSDISRISIIAELSPKTIAIEKGDEVEAIFVLQVLVKHSKYDSGNVALLAKLIPQKVVFLLVLRDLTCRLAIFDGKLYQTDWAESHTPIIQGANLDGVWANWVKSIKEEHECIQQSIQQTKLHQKIEALEHRARSEKQPKRKLVLVEEIKRLKELFL